MNQINEVNLEQDDLPSFFGISSSTIVRAESDPNIVVLFLEEVKEAKYSFKVSVENFIDDDKQVLHESLSFVDIFKEFKEN